MSSKTNCFCQCVPYWLSPLRLSFRNTDLVTVYFNVVIVEKVAMLSFSQQTLVVKISNLIRKKDT